MNTQTDSGRTDRQAKPVRKARFTLSGLMSLVLLYILLIALVLFFASQVIHDLSFTPSFSNSLVLILAVALPVFLIGTIALNISRLLRERRGKKPGAQFKIRLLVFFLIVIILSSVPQAILSINFIEMAMDSWFSTGVGDTIRGGLDLALEYYNAKLERLTRFSESEFFQQSFRNVEQHPDGMWREVLDVIPDIAGIQVLTETGEEHFFGGTEAVRLDPAVLENRSEGLLPKFSVQGASVLQILKRYAVRGRSYTVVLSMVLPANFDSTAERLTSSLQTFIQIERFQSDFRLAIVLFYFFFSFPLILLSILISFLLSDEIIRPIVNLEEATRRVAEGDYSFRILSRSGDELSMLISSFNTMVSELERHRTKITQTEKIAAWQEIAQRLAHEIKNPLTPIKLSAQRILRKHESDPAELSRILVPAVNAIIQEVDNLNALLTEFRNFARQPSPRFETVRLLELIEDSSSAYRSSFPLVRFHYEHIDPTILISADPGQIKQVFSNLFKNAVEAMEERGEIYIEADLVKKGNSHYCRVQVQDTGPGIDGEHRTQIFNPYFTTKPSGTGLGLAIVERIVFDHQGHIWFESEVNAGTTFFIDLPLEKQHEQDSHNRR
jgi:two-component system nitrogen regulation sensor histidine kinase NtrY